MNMVGVPRRKEHLEEEREKKAKLQRWKLGAAPAQHPSHPVPSGVAEQQHRGRHSIMCFHQHTQTYICIKYRHRYMNDADIATVLLSPKLYVRNNMETQLSQQQSWIWKRRAGVQM